MSSYFITGSSGFIGRALSQRLKRDGSVTGTFSSSKTLIEGIQTIAHDWTRPFLTQARADVFIHAAFAGTNKPTQNEAMAKNAAEAALRMGATRVMLISSGSVYAEDDGILNESSPPHLDAPGDSYSYSCQRIEDVFLSRFPPKTLTVARLFYPYGPGARQERLIPRLAKQILSGEPITLRPAKRDPGRPRINPIYITDCAEALARLCQISPGESASVIVNIGGPEVTTIRDLAYRLSSHLNREAVFRWDPQAPLAQDLVCAIETLEGLTGFRPQTGLDMGLQATLKALNL